jgi:hypothetical protein
MPDLMPFLTGDVKAPHAMEDVVGNICQALYAIQLEIFFFLITFIEPHGATHGELNQPSPHDGFKFVG